jgi:hypothetical protein
MAQAYAYARQGGFDPASAVIAASIAMAESGLVTNARGDIGKEDSTWGPSVGLMQIRTMKAQTGSGSDRDIAQLDDPVQNMVAAYHISHSGKDFSAWTTYNDGAFRQFLGQASTGSAAGGTVANVADSAGGLTTDTLAGKAMVIGLTLTAIAAGGVLVLLGGYRAVGSPKVPGALKAAVAL